MTSMNANWRKWIVVILLSRLLAQWKHLSYDFFSWYFNHLKNLIVSYFKLIPTSKNSSLHLWASYKSLITFIWDKPCNYWLLETLIMHLGLPKYFLLIETTYWYKFACQPPVQKLRENEQFKTLVLQLNVRIKA